MNIFLKLYHYFFGTVKLNLKGEFAERFFNILAADRISFWGIEKKTNCFTFNILIKDFKKLRRLRKKADIKLKIISKHGLPFVLHRYRNRYGIIIGCILFILLLNFASSRIWMIHVNGPAALSDSIVNTLEELKISSGARKKQLNTDLLKQKLLLSFDNLSWASLNVQGSVLEVNVVEFDNSNTLDKSACNLVASSDAVIKAIKVRSGRCEVKVGQTVTKGQVLVSGIKTEKGINSFIHSDGEIYASIPYDYSTKIPKRLLTKKYSDGFKTRYAIKIMSFCLPLSIGSVNGNFDTENSVNCLKFFGSEIPIYLYKQKVSFFNEETENVDKDYALVLAKSYLKRELEAENASEYEIVGWNIIENDVDYLVNISIRKTVNIAKKDFFKINSEK